MIKVGNAPAGSRVSARTIWDSTNGNVLSSPPSGSTSDVGQRVMIRYGFGEFMTVA
jgi:hypothetical protein